MALIRFSIYNELVSLFNPNSPPKDAQQSSKAIADAIVDYLKDVELEPIKLPVIVPSPGGPIPDPTFVPGPMKLINPESLTGPYNLLHDALLTVFNNFNELTSFTILEAGLNSYVTAAFSAQSFFHLDYVAVGNVIPTAPSGIEQIFKNNNSNHIQAADLLSEKLHNFFKNCLFTGNYFKGPILGTTPHISKLF
jgi:hypothetical protein